MNYNGLSVSLTWANEWTLTKLAGNRPISVLPSEEGTVVAFLYRISTDQVAGFGSTVKGAAARKLIEGPLEDLFDEQRK